VLGFKCKVRRYSEAALLRHAADLAREQDAVNSLKLANEYMRYQKIMGPSAEEEEKRAAARRRAPALDRIASVGRCSLTPGFRSSRVHPTLTFNV